LPEIIDFHKGGKKDEVPRTVVSSQQQEGSTCTSPKLVIGAEQEEVANMFGSHDWKVDHSSPHGKKGVLIHFHCLRCDAEGFATVVVG
jgi:hypothetical protein